MSIKTLKSNPDFQELLEKNNLISIEKDEVYVIENEELSIDITEWPNYGIAVITHKLNTPTAKATGLLIKRQIEIIFKSLYDSNNI